MPEGESQTYELPSGDYVGNDEQGEVSFTVPASGKYKTSDPREQAVIAAQFSNPPPTEPEVHDETGAVVGSEEAAPATEGEAG